MSPAARSIDAATATAVDLLAIALDELSSPADVTTFAAALASTDGQPGAVIPVMRIAELRGTGPGTVRASLKRCADVGLVTVAAELSDSGHAVRIFRTLTPEVAP